MAEKRSLTSMTVSLPTSEKSYVREQAASTGCSTPSEYIRRLIHADQKAHAEAELERQVLKGIDAPKRSLAPREWSKLRTRLRRQLDRRRNSR